MTLFFARFWPQVLGLALLAGAFTWYTHSVYQRGWDSRDADWKADTAKREKYGADERARLQLATDQIEITMSALQAQQGRKRDVEEIKTVQWRTEYRDNPDTGKCVIPADFVCAIDTAYEGLPEDAYAACREKTPTGGLSDRGVLSWGQDAKRVYTTCRDEVIWLRKYVDEVEALQKQ